MSAEAAPSRTGLSETAEAVVVSVFVAVAYFLLRTSPALAAGAFSDDGIYLALGKALADGLGYRSIYAVGDPVHLKYPPGLPFLHSLLWRMGGGVDAVHSSAILLSLVASAVSAGILWWIARARLRLPELWCGVFVLGPFLLEGAVQYFNLPISEPWFLLGWAGCLLLVPKAASGSWGWSLLVGVLAGVTTLFRVQAVGLIVASALAVLLRSRDWRRSALLAIAGGAPLLAWTIWHGARVAAGPISTQPDETTYASWMPTSIGAALRFLVDVPKMHAQTMWMVLPLNLAPWRWLGAVFWLVILLGFLTGVPRRFRDAPEIALSVVALAAIAVAWPFSQDRFVLTLLPCAGLITAGGVAGWADGARARGRPWGSSAVVALVVAMVVVVGLRQAQIRALGREIPDENTFYFHPAQSLPHNTRYILTASRWILARARPDDRVLAFLPAALWLYTGRRGVSMTPAESAVGPSVFDVPGRFLARRILEDDVTLLILWNPTFLATRDAALVQQTCPDALRFLERTESPAQIAIFRIEREDPCLVQKFLDPARAATS